MGFKNKKINTSILPEYPKLRRDEDYDIKYVHKNDLDKRLKAIEQQIELVYKLMRSTCEKFNELGTKLSQRDFLWNAYTNYDWKAFKHLYKLIKGSKAMWKKR